jgi:hypothetical protein
MTFQWITELPPALITASAAFVERDFGYVAYHLRDPSLAALLLEAAEAGGDPPSVP